MINRAAYYSPLVEEGFDAVRMAPGLISETSAADLREVLRHSWLAKFVPDHLSVEEVDEKIPSPEKQYENIAQPHRNANYWVTYTNRLSMPESMNALIRVEAYTPRASKLRRAQPYPSVTDLETLNGSLHGRYENHAAALLYLALDDYPLKVKAAAWSEAPNRDGISFFENLGFSLTGNETSEQIGSSVMRYVHLEAKKVNDVRAELEQQYPFVLDYHIKQKYS